MLFEVFMLFEASVLFEASSPRTFILPASSWIYVSRGTRQYKSVRQICLTQPHNVFHNPIKMGNYNRL